MLWPDAVVTLLGFFAGLFAVIGLSVLVGGVASNASGGGVPAAPVWFFFGAAIFVLGHFRRKATEMAVTNQRVIEKQIPQFVGKSY